MLDRPSWATVVPHRVQAGLVRLESSAPSPSPYRVVPRAHASRRGRRYPPDRSGDDGNAPLSVCCAFFTCIDTRRSGAPHRFHSRGRGRYFCFATVETVSPRSYSLAFRSSLKSRFSRSPVAKERNGSEARRRIRRRMEKRNVGEVRCEKYQWPKPGWYSRSDNVSKVRLQ